MRVPASKTTESTRRNSSMVPALFISHSSQDDAFVRELQRALGDQGVSVWIDSRNLLPGGRLAPDITKAIDEASAFAVVVSPSALQSKWVDKEVRYAIKVQKQRGREKFPVIPLSLDGTRLGALEKVFGTEPTYIPVSSCRWRRRGGRASDSRRAGAAEIGRRCAEPAARGQSARGARSRTHRLEV